MKAYAVNHTHPHKNTTIINSNFYRNKSRKNKIMKTINSLV